jgi:hypothetical protein
MRMLNIRPPWASLIVSGKATTTGRNAGVKDIENRDFEPRMRPRVYPFWMVIVQSKSAPTQLYLREARALVARDPRLVNEDVRVPNRDEYPLGAIVGVAEVTGVTYDPNYSVWYNGPAGGNVGWTIGRTFALPNPIPNVAGCLSLRFVSTHCDSARIARQLRVQLPDDILTEITLPERRRRRIVISDDEDDEDEEDSEPIRSRSLSPRGSTQPQAPLRRFTRLRALSPSSSSHNNIGTHPHPTPRRRLRRELSASSERDRAADALRDASVMALLDEPDHTSLHMLPVVSLSSDGGGSSSSSEEDAYIFRQRPGAQPRPRLQRRSRNRRSRSRSNSPLHHTSSARMSRSPPRLPLTPPIRPLTPTRRPLPTTQMNNGEPISTVVPVSIQIEEERKDESDQSADEDADAVEADVIEAEEPIPSWEVDGVISVRVRGIEGLDAFIRELFERIQIRFLSFLEPAVRERYAADTWDFNNFHNLGRLFKASDRTAFFGADDGAAVRYALNGGQRMALGRLYRAWTATGFGFPTHLKGLKYIYTTVLPRTLETYERIFGERAVLNDVTGLILKPPNVGSPLKSHQDGLGLSDALQACMEHRTVQSWVDAFGAQRLLHLHGGYEGGQTTALAPMNTSRFFAILLLMHPNHVHPDMQGYNASDLWDSHSYPLFFTGWYNRRNLQLFNRILRHLECISTTLTNANDVAWFAQIGADHRLVLADRFPESSKIPANVFRAMGKHPIFPNDGEANGPYIALWPQGWPHGSLKTGRVPRVTIVVPSDPEPNNERRARAVRRLYAIANGAHDYIRRDTTPYATGTAHRQPQRELELLDWFDGMYVDRSSDFMPVFSRHNRR